MSHRVIEIDVALLDALLQHEDGVKAFLSLAPFVSHSDIYTPPLLQHLLVATTLG